VRRINPTLLKLQAEGRQRATEKAKLRVMGAMHLQTEAGVTKFDAACNAIAAETGRPLEEVRAWLSAQVKKFTAAKEKLEGQYVAQEAVKQ